MNVDFNVARIGGPFTGFLLRLDTGLPPPGKGVYWLPLKRF
jgi:hypothetical protein